VEGVRMKQGGIAATMYFINIPVFKTNLRKIIKMGKRKPHVLLSCKLVKKQSASPSSDEREDGTHGWVCEPESVHISASMAAGRAQAWVFNRRYTWVDLCTGFRTHQRSMTAGRAQVWVGMDGTNEWACVPQSVHIYTS
jgi:hypothetical protein